MYRPRERNRETELNRERERAREREGKMMCLYHIWDIFMKKVNKLKEKKGC